MTAIRRPGMRRPLFGALLAMLAMLPLVAAPLAAQPDSTTRPVVPAVVAQPAGAVRQPTLSDTSDRARATVAQEMSRRRQRWADVAVITVAAGVVGGVAGTAFKDWCVGGNRDNSAARAMAAGALVAVPVSLVLRGRGERGEVRRWLSRVPDPLKVAVALGVVGAASGVPMGLAAGSLDSRCDGGVGRATLNGVGQMTAAGVATGLALLPILYM